MPTQIRGNVDIKDLTVTNAKIVSLAWSKLTGPPTTLAGYGITSPLPVAQGGTGATAFTAGSVVFAGASGVYSQDNANFFWDNSNKRLGIGVTPAAMLDLFSSTAQATIKSLGASSTAPGYYHNNNDVTAITINRNPATGGFADTGKCAAEILLIAQNGSSHISFATSAVNNTLFTERMLIDKNGHVGIGMNPATAWVHIKAGTAAAGTAPLKLTSGTVLTTAEAGAIEFLTDDYFATITTGAARKAFVLDDGARLTSGKIPVASTNGRLIDGPTWGARQTYTETNVTTDRAYDANATTLDEIADVLGTLIADLRAKNMVA